MANYFENKKIESQSWQDGKIVGNEYENCIFSNCDFSNAQLQSCNLIDCEFHNCNLSMAKLSDTIFNGVKFLNCKILGVKFDCCNDFIFDVFFSDSILDYCSFEKRKMSKTVFSNCSLKGTSFIEAKLKQATFDNCNLDEAVFLGANLQEADFTTSYNYTINLQENFVKKTRFGKDGLQGLLRNFDIIIEDI